MAGAKKPKNDDVKHPWIARPGDFTPTGKVSAKQKKVNDEFNEIAGLVKRKPTASKAKKATKSK